jgi:hypothetical protein
MAVLELIRSVLVKAAETQGVAVIPRFLASEWTHIVDAWQVRTVEDYAGVPRLGRKNRVGAKRGPSPPGDSVADEVELEEVYATERHLFYVACTRARDRLLISG